MKWLLLSFTFYLFGHISDEDSKLRQFLLKGYAWKEVELLKILFSLSKQPIMKKAWFRKPFYYLFAHFLGTRGIVVMAATLDETIEFINNLPDEYKIAVGPCRCRVGNRNCSHEIMTDIVIRETAKIWYKDLFPQDYRIISKEEAKEICRTSRAKGMIQCIDRHMYFRKSENFFVICNCCKESCVPVIAYRVFKKEPYTFLPSRSIVKIDTGKCKACGKCVEVCPFDERELDKERGFVSVYQCQGCGLCVNACPEGSNSMVPRPA
jgi:NAD-dependent dihydropyrimidine dehydrogenase PreA subunit